MWKHFISGYLSFTKKERTGVLVVISMVILLVLLPFFYPYFIKRKTYDHVDFERSIASLQIKHADSTERNPDKNDYQNYAQSPGLYDYKRPSSSVLFYFDPNSATASEWKRLGVRDKTIATIQHYLSKGGKFYKKEDISKIWGLHEDEVKRLTPYIQILIARSVAEPAEKEYKKKEYEKRVYTVAVVDINNADTTAFIALPGIGSKLSQRIVHFRDRLGGFYKIEQIGETFGLADSSFQKIKAYLKIDEPELKRININTATVDEMKTHPYIRYALANAIIQFRAQHGNYSAVEDIKKLMPVTAEVFNKLAPYLTVN